MFAQPLLLPRGQRFLSLPRVFHVNTEGTSLIRRAPISESICAQLSTPLSPDTLHISQSSALFASAAENDAKEDSNKPNHKREGAGRTITPRQARSTAPTPAAASDAIDEVMIH